MALSVSELIDEVQTLVGRPDDVDPILITPARIVRWLNEAQLDIVDKCTGHLDLEHKHVTAVALAAGTFSYSITSISPTVRHLLKVFYLDGASSKMLNYRDTEEFDRDYPSPSNLATGIPSKWTRRANAIEVYAVPTSAEAGKYLRLDYTKKPTMFTTSSLSATCDMSDADTGLIYYAVAEAFRAIGGDKIVEANNYRNIALKTGWYYDWLEEYQKLKDGLYATDANTLLP